MSIEQPEEPYALNEPLSGEPNEDRVVTDARTGEDEPRDVGREEFDVEQEMDRDDYVPSGEGRPEGSEGDEVIEDDSGPVGARPVPDPDAPSTGDDEPATSTQGDSQDT